MVSWKDFWKAAFQTERWSLCRKNISVLTQLAHISLPLEHFLHFLLRFKEPTYFPLPPIVLDVQMPNSHNLSSNNDFFSQVSGDETVHNFEAFNWGNQCVSQCQLQRRI